MRIPTIAEPVRAGGTAYFLRGGWIVELQKGAAHVLVEAAVIPATMSGTATIIGNPDQPQ